MDKLDMKDVSAPDLRRELILSFLLLSNREYQDNVWDNRKSAEKLELYCFSTQIQLILDFLVNDLLLEDPQEDHSYQLGVIYRNKEEIEISKKVTECIVDYWDFVDSSSGNALRAQNGVFMSAPNREILIISAKNAFETFMKNEKYNRLFVKFIEDIEGKMAKYQLI